LIDIGLNQFENIQCNILDDILNLSDHKALSVTFEIDSNINMVEKEEHITSNINLADPLINQEFKRLIMLILDSLSPEINSKVIHTQESIDIFYEKIFAFILNAERSTIDFQSQLYPHIEYNKIKFNKPWFNHELVVLKKKILNLRNKTNVPHELSILRAEYRKKQRQLIHLFNLKELNKFETIAREKNKNRFWRFIRKKKN
jgi:hypothetical protein